MRKMSCTGNPSIKLSRYAVIRRRLKGALNKKLPDEALSLRVHFKNRPSLHEMTPAQLIHGCSWVASQFCARKPSVRIAHGFRQKEPGYG
jgi:hypothetical protein